MSDTDNSGIIASMKTAEVDQRFVGIWSGTDHGKFFKGETNSWMVNRRRVCDSRPGPHDAIAS